MTENHYSPDLVVVYEDYDTKGATLLLSYGLYLNSEEAVSIVLCGPQCKLCELCVSF